MSEGDLQRSAPFPGEAEPETADDATETVDSVEYLPFHRPSIREEDISSVSMTLRSGWLTHGPMCGRKESL